MSQEITFINLEGVNAPIEFKFNEKGDTIYVKIDCFNDPRNLIDINFSEWMFNLKELLDAARQMVHLENETHEDVIPNDKQALTQIFLELKTNTTPQIVANIVEDIDKIIRATRFEGWQNSITGERDIQKVLRQTLFKYKLHKEQELFEKAYGYIREHY